MTHEKENSTSSRKKPFFSFTNISVGMKGFILFYSDTCWPTVNLMWVYKIVHKLNNFHSPNYKENPIFISIFVVIDTYKCSH